MATQRRKGSWALKVAAISLAVVIGYNVAERKISSTRGTKK
jgi:hypothetical protein